MEWKEAYSLQIPEIDKEHQIMVEYVTVVERAIANGEPASAVEAAIGRLASFAVTHFGFEETLMRIQEYPGSEDHMESHQRFLMELKAIQEQAGSSSPSKHFVGFLHTWLERHFLADDRLYASSLTSKARELVRKYVPS